MQSIWSLAASEGVDVFLTGHDHNYQRWNPLGATGAKSTVGMRQFVVGTGAHESYAIQGSDPRVAFALTTIGALRFELRNGRARFAFVKPNGNAIDSGRFTCSSPVDPLAAAMP